MKIINNESLTELRQHKDNTYDSIVTDPPYLISFMSKDWDSKDSVAGKAEFWKECMRVLKPGGHIVVFSHSRTYHRVATAIEDAGFEIRDQIMWIYGSGFPKSHNIGKAYDKKMGNERVLVGKTRSGNHTDATSFNALADKETKLDVTKGTSPYEGWGTALKPSHEPIVLARKPLSEKTVVDNVIKWGVGGINIDGCRVETTDTFGGGAHATNIFGKEGNKPYNQEGFVDNGGQGRFPANTIHDGSDEVLELFPNTAAPSKALKTYTKQYSQDTTDIGQPGGKFNPKSVHPDGGGSAARFFYCAKVSKKERNVGCDTFDEALKSNDGRIKTNDTAYQRGHAIAKNSHPTVKPVALMSYLCKLITPKGGLILDPFMGSGSTGMAAKQEGFSFIGIEMDDEYCKIAKARIEAWK